MASNDYLPASIRNRYEVHDYRHAAAILKYEFPDEMGELCAALDGFQFDLSSAKEGGGARSIISQKMRDLLEWPSEDLVITKNVAGGVTIRDEIRLPWSKGRVALFLRWNQKHEAFDQDLYVFKTLHELDRISLGIIVTRSDELNEALVDEGETKFRGTTTHMGKLLPRMEARRNAGCPVLVLGITRKAMV